MIQVTTTTTGVDMKNDNSVAIGDLSSIEKGSGARRNGGKVEFSALPLHLMAGVARVLMFGKMKYKAYNWAKGMDYSYTFDCAMRHLIKWFYCREELDPETGEHHLDHAICNLLFLKHYSLTHPGGDDRPPTYTDFHKWLDDVNTPFDIEAAKKRSGYGKDS